MRPHFRQLTRLTACRSLFLLAVTVVIMPSPSANGEELTPYRARVVAASAQVLSGPGEKFYPTDTLAEGDTVEVYRQQSNGWCAVRPTEGSFSWVFGRHVKLHTAADGETVAEIDKEEVASRIGSRLSSHRNAVQVRLKKGEVLRVLGDESADGETWYKIAPPAGEFRWVHVSALQRVGAIGTIDAPEPKIGQRENAVGAASGSAGRVSNAIATEPISANPLTANALPTSDSSPTTTNPITPTSGDAILAAPPLAPAPSQSPLEQWRPAPDKATMPSSAAPTPKVADRYPQPIANDYGMPAAVGSSTDITPIGATPTPTTLTPSTQPISTQPVGAPTAAVPPVVAGVATPPSATAPVATLDNTAVSTTTGTSHTLAQLELRLSRMVSDPPTNWNIGPLRAEADALLAQSQALNDRAAVQATIAKIDRFAAIEHRYRGTPATAAADTNGYDAVGYLRPVSSRRPGAPPYALVDDRGQVISFVTPTPGISLQAYLGQRIGVNGTRGYIPEFQRNHVVAGRVAPAPDRIVR